MTINFKSLSKLSLFFAILFVFCQIFTLPALAQSCGEKEVTYNSFECNSHVNPVTHSTYYTCDLTSVTRDLGCSCSGSRCIATGHFNSSCQATSTGCSMMNDSFPVTCDNSYLCSGGTVSPPPASSPQPSPTSSTPGSCDSSSWCTGTSAADR